MKAIRQIKKITDHKIIIDLPKSFKSKEVEIIVLPLEDNKVAVVETMLLSEPSLGKDWNKAEEEDAWKNL